MLLGKMDFTQIVQDTVGLVCFPKTCLIGKYLIFIHHICYGKEVRNRDGVGMMPVTGSIFLALSWG